MPRRITKVGERSNPVYRSFIASFGVDFIERHPALRDAFPLFSTFARLFRIFAVDGINTLIIL